MSKKYYEILVVENVVKYVRWPSFSEIFIDSYLSNNGVAFGNGYYNNESNFMEYATTPTSFDEFLTLLSKTKMNKNGDYDIVFSYLNESENIYRFESISFDELLYIFVENINLNGSFDEEKILSFYDLAYQIKDNMQNDRNVLNK